MLHSLNFSGIRGLHIVHGNIRSLPSKFNQLKAYLTDSSITLLSLSETWLTQNIPDYLSYIPGYKLLRHDRTWEQIHGQTKKGGGLCCYVNINYTFSHIDLLPLNVSTQDVELQCITLDQKFMKKMVIINLYRPPQGNPQTFIDTLSDTYNRIQILYPNSEIIALGDFNIDFNDKLNANTKKLKWIEQSTELKQQIKGITRHSNKGSCIDLLYTNMTTNFTTRILNVNLSDHEFIYLNRKHVPKPITKLSFKGRTYKNYNKELFSERLTSKDWTDYYTIDDVDRLWSILYDCINQEADVMCPWRNYKIAKAKDPWITNELLEMIKDKDRLLRKAKKSQFEQHWDNARHERNIVNQAINSAKSKFIKENLNENQNDPKKFWQNIHTVLPNKNTSSTLNLKDINGNFLNDDLKTASLLNEYFTNIGPSLAGDMSDPWIFNGNPCDSSLGENIVATPDEVSKLVKDINITKASALDRLSSRLIKDALLCLNEQFTYLINTSFAQGTFPSQWKMATIIPLPKDGDTSLPNNFRPISLLPIPGKIIERIMYNRLIKHLDLNHILVDNQGGFRKNNSTINSVSKFIHEIYTSINDKEITLSTFIDFSKAFDTVNHEILLQKLHLMGIKNVNFDWLSSYLTNRFQKTCVNNTSSPSANIVCGVPQGSILGPLLFLVYVNDLPTSVNYCSIYLYADDTRIQYRNCQKLYAI